MHICIHANLSATLTTSPSRRARFDLYDFNPNNDELAQIILQECPEGVNPILWDMLKSIKQDTAKSSSKADKALNRVGILEDQADNSGAQIACIIRVMAALTLSNKVLSARLQRAEWVIQRQKADILDLRGRSMRDNIIVKTKGETYRELRERNTALKFRSFLANEMRVANVDRIEIPRSHRMGRAGNGYNRMMITKVPMESDQRRIFANTEALKNTVYISHQDRPNKPLALKLKSSMMQKVTEEALLDLGRRVANM